MRLFRRFFRKLLRKKKAELPPPTPQFPPWMVTTQALIRSALVTLGVAAGSLLAPQAASALEFTFSFGSFGDRFDFFVSGLIENLAEGQNTCDGTTSCVVKVTNNGGMIGAEVGPYERFLGGGFVVTSGVMSFADWVGSRPPDTDGGLLVFEPGRNGGIVGFLQGDLRVR